MIVSLIDVDSILPNLALMKISAYHKSRGDMVQLGWQSADITYVSCIFTKNGPQTKGLLSLLDCPDIRIGGTGVDINIKLPDEIEHIMPDYTLYKVCSICGKTRSCHCKNGKRVPMWYSMGFSTRGCIRDCDFCIVRQKEGDFTDWDGLEKFHDPSMSTIMLMDNNLLAGNWKKRFDYIKKNNIALWEHGMDIRLMTVDIARSLARLRSAKGIWRFAFDNMKDEKAVRKGIKILLDAGIRSHSIGFYVLVGYNTSPEEDIYRVKLLREYGVVSIIMVFNDVRDSIHLRKIDRYANNKIIYYSMTWEEFNLYCKNRSGNAHLHSQGKNLPISNFMG